MGAGFVTTRWSLVLAAGGGDGTQSSRALQALCEAYWYPLYAYTRRRGYDPDQARDATQAFFVDLLERGSLHGLDPGKGQFRAFLLASIRNFLSHERCRTQATKRGGGLQVLSLDLVDAEGRFHREPATELTPEDLFERRWGLTVMERAMARLEELVEGSGRPRSFETLKPFLTGGESSGYRYVAAELGMSVGAVKVAVHRLRQSYGRLLREEIAETVVDERQVDAELRHLLTKIRPWEI